MNYSQSRQILLNILSLGKPCSVLEVSKRGGLRRSQAGCALALAWRCGLILRTFKPVVEIERVNKGRAGRSQHLRSYHLYMARVGDEVESFWGGKRFVGFSRDFVDPRGGGGVSKAGRILEFLRVNCGEAYYTTTLAEKLSEFGVKVRDVMSSARVWERKGLVYIRGYKLEDRETPFLKGYMLTWIDQSLPREAAIRGAVDRTESALKGVSSGSPLMERVMKVWDIVVEHSKMRKLVAFTYIHDKLSCTPDQTERAVLRAMQLYQSLRAMKLFNLYRYYYHESLEGDELVAAVEMKKNYIRITQGHENRIGHNWEAAADWFIDQFTQGAKFWTQQHREGGMDPRRITLLLLKGVGYRRRGAEVDRVWEVNPGVFAPPITYVLSCKWSLITKRHIDDFMEVLRWSKEFGVDTPQGREMKQGVVGVFAAGSFNPKENVEIMGEKISLPKYAARRNFQIITASEFNDKLRERGCNKKVTIQKLCRLAENEKEVRTSLDDIWKKPYEAEKLLATLSEKNEKLYEFEKSLEQEKSPIDTMDPDDIEVAEKED